MQDLNKYPKSFEDASHGLVLGAYAEDGYAWARACKIIHRPEGMIAIEGAGGTRWTFTVRIRADVKSGVSEYGKITQAASPRWDNPKEFEVIPFNYYERN